MDNNKMDEKEAPLAAEPPGAVREFPVEVVVGRTKVVVTLILKANTSVTVAGTTTTVAKN